MPTNNTSVNSWAHWQPSPYLPHPVRPGEVVNDEGLWVNVSETLSNIGTNAGARSPCYTHHGHEPSQSIAALHLSPHQLFHHFSVTRTVDTIPGMIQKASHQICFSSSTQSFLHTGSVLHCICVIDHICKTFCMIEVANTYNKSQKCQRWNQLTTTELTYQHINLHDNWTNPPTHVDCLI